MKNWTDLLTQRHGRYYESGDSQLVLPAPVSEQAIAEFKRSTGYHWTEEFCDLYSHHDGVGLALPNQEMAWQFLPTREFHGFSVLIRDWFVKTHPSIAEVYYPFFDWGSGDAMGYLDLPDVPQGVLVEFEHEAYEFDAKQPWSSFLKQSHDSIRSFLTI
jgi:hypothetical protein